MEIMKRSFSKRGKSLKIDKINSNQKKKVKLFSQKNVI